MTDSEGQWPTMNDIDGQCKTMIGNDWQWLIVTDNECENMINYNWQWLGRLPVIDN